MDKTIKDLLSIGHELQALGYYKLTLLQPAIVRVLAAEEADTDEIERLLDELYVAVLRGYGQAEYKELLHRLEQVDPEAALFYGKELKELTTQPE